MSRGRQEQAERAAVDPAAPDEVEVPPPGYIHVSHEGRRLKVVSRSSDGAVMQRVELSPEQARELAEALLASAEAAAGAAAGRGAPEGVLLASGGSGTLTREDADVSGSTRAPSSPGPE